MLPYITSSFEDDDAVLGILIQSLDEPENLDPFEEIGSDINISPNGVDNICQVHTAF
jgi:hypothetical protein